LLEELRNAPFVVQPQKKVGEHAVVFLFGMIFKYLRFKDISIGHSKDLGNKLDASAWSEDDEELFIEFESRSKHLEKRIRDSEVKLEDYKNTLIVFWDVCWKERAVSILNSTLTIRASGRNCFRIGIASEEELAKVKPDLFTEAQNDARAKG
jgi:hypothetical protein